MEYFRQSLSNLNIVPLAVGVVVLVTASVPLAVQSQGIYVMNITCPAGWQLALNNCYLFNVKDQLSWSEARTECALLNSDLMIIGSQQEKEWINVQTEEYKTDGWWIGLAYTSSWKWVQYGGDTTLIKWRNEPDNYDEQDCCAINPYGLFSDEYCKSKLGFICSYSIQRGQFCPSPGDNSRWLMTDTTCFYISSLLNTSQHLTWSDANTYCTNLSPKSKLMTVTSIDDMRSLKSLLSTYDAPGVLLPWWTGLNDQAKEGTYVWGLNGPIANGTILQWDVAPSSDRSQRRNCGVMYQGGSIDDVTCDKRSHYVCEMTAFQGHLNLGCGSWLRGGKSCYLLGKGKGYTWNQAKDQCARANAHLVKVDGLDEKGWLEDLDLGPTGYWTGLTRAHNTYGWAWQDHSAATPAYIKWSTEPNNSGGKEDCVEIHKDGLYNDRQCDAKAGYICEYKLVYGKTCLPGWSPCPQTQSCYYFSPPNNSFAVTWYEAKQTCMDLLAGNSISAYRLAVNDKNEQTCVNSLLQSQPDGAPGYWTDLSDLQVKGIWRYTEAFNNEPNYDVITWAKEPNNVNNTENCAVIYNHGNYNDMNCEAKAFYICERSADNVSGSSTLYSLSLTNLVSLLLTYHFL
ncbi:macrophage mannose receptor 1-like [Mercenaria mercenaria]|uniref:macrophage mannose receptor 1-like n=1 Tax=Mercenaria mercenaria TaxID=6596 RepID=UPI00234F753A|nr:macrophage mannose receptor 1-like [Mercenaria mercenaria]